MKLVIAEKPSVARDIAAVIGASENVDGVLRGNGYLVTSAQGHLVRLKEPQEYDEKYDKWSIADLPIIPSFEFVPIDNVKPVLARLDKLMNSKDVDEIVKTVSLLAGSFGGINLEDISAPRCFESAYSDTYTTMSAVKSRSSVCGFLPLPLKVSETALIICSLPPKRPICSAQELPVPRLIGCGE